MYHKIIPAKKATAQAHTATVSNERLRNARTNATAAPIADVTTSPVA